MKTEKRVIKSYFCPEDFALLRWCQKRECTSRSAVLRKAVRAYAQHLGHRPDEWRVIS